MPHPSEPDLGAQQPSATDPIIAISLLRNALSWACYAVSAFATAATLLIFFGRSFGFLLLICIPVAVVARIKTGRADRYLLGAARG